MSQAMFMMNLSYLSISPNLKCQEGICCNEFLMSNQLFGNLINEWYLACGREYGSALISTAYFIVLSLGTYIFMHLTNRIGRKLMTITGLIITTTILIVSAASPSDEVFIILNLITVLFVTCTIMSSFIYIQECVDGEFRNIYGGVIFTSWGIGMALMSVINSFIIQWRLRIIIIGLTNIIWLLFLLKFYESPRFLASNLGKYSKARCVLNRIAEYNQRQPFSEMIEGEKVIGYQEPNAKYTIESASNVSKYSFIPISNGMISVTEIESADIKKYSYCDLIQLKSLREAFWVMNLMSLILSVGYYWVVQNIPRLIENSQLNEGVMAITDGVSCLLMSLLLNKIGRQIGFVMNFGIAGICCLTALGFINDKCSTAFTCSAYKIFQFSLLFFAKILIASARLISYIYAVEIFPTTVRGLAFGFFGFFSIIGRICRPLFLILSLLLKANLLIFIGLLFLICSLFSFLIIETFGKNMEDYVEEEKEVMRTPEPVSIEPDPNSAEPLRPFERLNESNS